MSKRNSSGKLRSLLSKTFTKRNRQRDRTCRFEQLEARRVLAVAIWNNAVTPLNVNGDPGGFVAPNDVLAIVNELNAKRFADPAGRLPKEVDPTLKPFFYDVNCDGFVSPIDALGVINYLNSGADPQPGGIGSLGGTWANASCSPQLIEGDGFATELTRRLTLPDDSSAIKVLFQAPEFDTSSESVRDAFEIEVTDTGGNPIAFAYQPNRDASYNWSEGQGVVFGPGVQTITEPAGQDSSATIYLAGMDAGTEVIVRTRLVNNDGDNASSVIVRGFEVIDSDVQPPAGRAGFTARPIGVERPEWNKLTDLTSSLVPRYGRSSLAGDNTELLTELAVTNQGRSAVLGRMIVVVENMSEIDAAPMRPDGFTPDGDPYYDLTHEMDGQPLEPGDTIRSRELRFLNNSGVRFRYNLRTLGDVNRVPSGFTSTPDGSIESGRTYRYTAVASDPDGQPLSFSVVAGPQSAAIDAATGVLSWPTTSDDLGQQRIVLRATDTHGLYVEQAFSVEVKEVQQNRPPIFTSDPITEAIASSGFEITTVGVGSSPAGAAVIGGFRGPRIVTANAADQTIGVYAGENNDRFDDATSYSTGHPIRNGQWVDSGTLVDIGFPENEVRTDAYDVSSYDQGDFNGDGALDFVVGLNFDRQGDDVVGTYKTAIVLGDGNGSFGKPTFLYEREIYGYQSLVRTILVADLNADGADDVLFSEGYSEGRFFVALGNGDGTFQPIAETTFEDTIIADFKIADIDGDNVLDLFGRTITSKAFGGGARSLFWSKGIGDGTFEDPNEFRETRNSGLRETTAPYDLSDLDGDGDLDFVVSGDNQLMQVFHNDGQGGFTLVNEFDPPGAQAFYGPDWLVVADFTGDGTNDILFHHVWQSHLGLMIGEAGGVDFTLGERSDVRLRPDNWANGFEPIDIDGDGDLDIAFGTEISKQGLSVGLNDGTGRFLIREYAIPEMSTGVKINYMDATVRGALFGDYNADGVIDVSYFTTDNDFNGQTDVHGVGILFGTRPGEFGRTRTEPWLTASWNDVAHPGDFNGDGILDILDTASDVTALGNGDGTFGELVPASGVRRPSWAAAVSDYDNDGLDDVVSTLEGGLYVGLSNGDGTFTVNQSISGGGFYGYTTIEAVDLNSDGFIDFVTKVEVDEYFEAYLNDPLNPGTFTMSFTYALAPGSQGVNVSQWEESWDVADFTGDGIPDLLTAERENLGPDHPIKIVIFAGDGAGDFIRYSELAGYDEDKQSGIYGSRVEPGDFATGDIDGDGDLDLIAYSYLGGRVFFNDGAGNFTPTGTMLDVLRTNQRGRDSWLVDFDEDGHLDFVVGAGADINGAFYFWRGDGTGDFEIVEGVNMHAENLGIREPFIDWDNDGHLDLVYNTGGTTSDEIAFYMGRRDDLVDMIAVDLNGDGNEEILAVQEQMERIQIFVGDNLGGLTRQPDLQAGQAPQAVNTVDLDGDGQLEILVANRVSRDVTVYSGDLSAGYTSTAYSVGDATNLAARPVDISSADVDGDGNPEVFVLDAGEQALWMFTGDGTTSLSTPTAIAIGDLPGRFVLQDATGDGVLDAVITLPESKRLMILPSVGLATAGAPAYIDLAESPSDIAVLDLNDDGNPDLAATIPSGDVISVHYGLGNNQFARPQEIYVGDGPNRIEVADADEDGRLDLVATNAGDGTVSVIYNRFNPNEVYQYDADAIDPDDDTLTYAIVSGPGGLIINSQNGKLLWAASPDQVGTHDVTLSADDGRGGVATQSFMIEVEPARENSTPLIATTSIGQIGANEAHTYSVQAIDSDNHPLRYSLVEGPEGAIIHPTSGELNWDGRTQAEEFGKHSTGGYISVPVAESLRPESITLEGWFQFSDLTIWPGWREMFSQQGIRSYVLADDTFRTDISLDGETIRLYHSDLAEVGTWTHVAVTYDATTGTGQLFVDGQLTDSASFSTPRPLETTPAITNVGVSGRTYASIENYRIWNYARNETEVAAGLVQNFANDDRIVLDLRFEDGKNDLSVRDHSLYGNHGYRIDNGGPPQIAAGLTELGSYDFTIVVEDGRGGRDQQSFTLNVVPELRGGIVGHLFEDLNGDGVQNDGSEEGVPAEPSLEGWHLFIDSNGNSFPDPSEPQAVTDTEGNYRFESLLPGEYPVSVSPVAGYSTPEDFTAIVQSQVVEYLLGDASTRYDMAIEQMALSQVRGKLQSEEGAAISYWKAYVDLDGDGRRSDAEPVAMSDRDGNFALTGLDAGTYTIRPDLPAGWTDSAGRDGLTLTLGTDEVSEGNDFTLRATNTSVTGGLHFVTMPTAQVEARQTFTYASIALSIADQPIAYDLSLAPDGMTVDAATGLVAWRPSIAQVGEHLVVLRATAADGSIALHDFYLTVAAPNTAPILSGIGFQPVNPPKAYAGLAYAINLAAQDAEQDNITSTLRNGPNGATLDARTGELRWVPAASAVGSQDFSIELQDASGNASHVDFAVEVLDQQPPATPFNIKPIRNRVGIGQDYFAQLRGSDALGRPLAWTLASGPAGLTLDSNNTLQWTPGNAQLGQHAIELEAMSPNGDTEQHSIAIEVVGRAVSSAPEITSDPRYSATIDHLFAYDVAADDADLDPLAYALLDGPVGMSLHPSHGTLRWTPAADQRGEHSVTLQVTDPDGETDEQTFKVAVSRFGGPPRITSIPPTEAAVGVGYLYSVRANDAEGDPLTYQLLTAPAGMTIVESTGEITWTPTTDQLGEQDIVIEVSDGVGGAATQALRVLVADGAANLPPEIESAAPRFTAVGETYHYVVAAADPEGQQVSFSLGQAPHGMAIDEATGELSWTPSSDQAGQHVITIIASDEGGATAVESYQLDVLAENSPPAILGEAPTTLVAGAAFRYDLMARDPDRDALTFSLVEAPVGAEIDAFGRLTWQSANDDIGTHDFEVMVRDSRGGQAMQSFTLDVVADTEGPRVSLIETPNDASRNILPWQGPFVVFARAIDNVGVASLTLTANGQDIPLDAAGTATFNFDDWFFDTINATATATDVNGNTTTRTISFNYDVPEGWSTNPGPEVPTAVITSPADSGTAFGMVSITGTADHENFGAYTLSYRHIDETSFTEIVRSTDPVVDGELGVWDTSLLLNDEYVIRLQVATTEGTANVVEHNVGLSGELKLGNFSLSFTDMVIPVAGIPIEITRIYDTLQADRQGDFGYGWRLEYRNTDLRVGLPKSGLEDIGIYTPLRPGVKVYLNVPGQGRQGFTFNPDIRVLPGWGGNNLVLARPRFTPDPGVTSTLGTGTSSYLQVNELGQLYAPGGIPYNPASPDFGGAYVLMTREGTSYRINGATGKLDSATDRNGNTLRFTEAGISYGDNATGVQIQRDSYGRIVSLIDPNGNSLQYGYSSGGDLSRVVDREGHETTMVYSTVREHYLEDVIDPLQRSGAKTEYDEDGRLINVYDSLGNVVAFSSDPNNFIESLTDADGNEYTVEYDQQGNIVTQIDALGAVTRRTFDSHSNLTSETDPLGNTTTYAYDAAGNLASITDPLGGKQAYQYGINGVIVKEVDAIGAATNWTLDANGNPLNRIDPDGSVTSYSYDASGNVLAVADAHGNLSTYTYDSRGNMLSETDPLGHTVSYTYDGSSNRLTEAFKQTLASGVVQVTTTWIYDGNDRAVSMIDAAGNVERTEYNSLGLKSARIDAHGKRTEYSYDERGLLVSTTYADGTSKSISYDDSGRQIQGVDQLGRVTKYVHDAVGNVVTTIYPDETPGDDSDNPRVHTAHDLANRVTTEIDEEGNRTVYRYDASGRLTKIFFPDSTPEDLSDNIVIANRYDARGFRTQQNSPSSGMTRYEYDSRGNLVLTRFADGTVTQQSFDSLQRRVASIDQNGVATAYEYDSNGRLVAAIQSLEDAADPLTVYDYDERGNLTRQIDPNGNATSYHYDTLSRRVGTTMALGQESSMTYDAVGNMATHTNFNGETIGYSYDAMNRLVLRDLPDGTSFAYTYTATGQKKTIVDERGTTTYIYDARDRVVSRTEPDGTEISYTYDMAGRELTQTTPDGTVTKTYSALGNLNTVADPDGGITTYVYDDRGRQVKIQFPNGVVDTYTLDELSRIRRIDSTGPNGLLRSMDYTLDATGRRIQIAEESGRVVDYKYDTLYRLTEEHIVAPNFAERTIEYTYDTFGNRLAKQDSVEGLTAYTYDANDRLVESNFDGVTTTYTYDANGNTMTEFTDNDNQRSYTWNAENRLIAATDVEGGTTTESAYKYDEEGLRVESTTSGATVRSLLDKNVQYAQVVFEYAPNGVVQTSYVRGNQLVSMSRDGERAYYHADAIGTIRILTDGTGGISNEYAYDAFGNTLHSVEGIRNPMLYAGEYRADSIGWDFLRDRYLNTETGRFVSRDPFDGFILEPLSLNRWTYVQNDPLNYTDPSGNFGLKEVAISGFIVGTLVGLFVTGPAVAEFFGGSEVVAGYREDGEFLFEKNGVRYYRVITNPGTYYVSYGATVVLSGLAGAAIFSGGFLLATSGGGAGSAAAMAEATGLPIEFFTGGLGTLEVVNGVQKIKLSADAARWVTVAYEALGSTQVATGGSLVSVEFMKFLLRWK